MTSLWNIYQSEVMRNPCKEAGITFLNNPSNVNGWEYIRYRFNYNGKKNALSIGIGKKRILERAAHSVSAYLLGASLIDAIIPSLKIELENHLKPSEAFLFTDLDYPWFLCCLYHDLLTSQENHDYVEKTGNLDDFLHNRISVFSTDIPEKYEIAPVHHAYSNETIAWYYRYRIRSSGCIDHGISSGIIAFDKLCKEYESEKSKNGNKNHFSTRKGALLWSNRLIWVYGLVADAIIAHNIWHINPEEAASDVPPELIIGGIDERKLIRDHNPLAYFLSLIDTIEPIKCFTDRDPREVLENLSVTIEEDTLYCRKISNHNFDMKKWYRRICGMSDWLKDVRVSPQDPTTGSFYININAKGSYERNE